MSEPKAKAKELLPVDRVQGLFHWSVKDDRIGGAESDAFALAGDGKLTLIDPLPIEAERLSALGDVEAVVLTAGNHQRSAWRLRRELGAPVFAPRRAYGLLEEPDGWFEGGDALPGGLVAFHAPGPVESMHALWTLRPTPLVFMSDLLTSTRSGRLSFVASEYQDDPARTRLSVRRILEALRPQVLCFSHGPPLTRDASAALERVLAEDGPAHASER
jgi:hypothetical protein